MTIAEMLSRDTILSSTMKLPFSAKDQLLIDDRIQSIREDLGIPMEIIWNNGLEYGHDESVLLLRPLSHSEELIMLVNIQVGTGFFGYPTTRIYCFFSPPGQAHWALLGAYEKLATVFSIVARLYESKYRPENAKSLDLLKMGGFSPVSSYS